MAQSPRVTDADRAGGIDLVVSDSPDVAGGLDDGEGFVRGHVRLVWGAASDSPVGSLSVVDDCEPRQLGVELGDGRDEAVGGQPLFERLVIPLDLALGRGVVRGPVLLHDPQIGEELFEPVGLLRGAVVAAGEAGGVDHAVIGQR